MRKNYYLFFLGALLSTGFSKAQTTETFVYTGSPQTFTVPSCVTQVTITVNGAKGSNGIASNSPGGIGGNGAIVTGTYQVNGGDVFNIYVGGEGTTTAGGFNGGGVSSTASSAGGGGASDVRYNGSALTDRIIVAGGGGAGGNGGCFGNTIVGGDGGPGGGDGVAGTNSVAGGGGGFPGLGTTGGSFGVGCGPFQGQAGLSGANGVGGAGGQGTTLCTTSPTSGGSGGGGYIGGGGGGAGAAGTASCQFNDTGAGGGGAGGDSYVAPSMTNTSITVGGAAPGNGSVTITYTVLPNPTITQSTGGSICGSGIVNISASASAGTIDWYDAPTGGNLITSGDTYSPNVSATTTFYAEANLGNGCGSSSRTAVIVTVNNDVNGPTTTTSSCGDYDWNGTIYTTSGVYNQVLATTTGCDSTITLNLTVNNDVTGPTTTAASCGDYDWNGTIYTTSGVYNQVLSTTTGCDSSVTLNLTVDNVDLGVTLTGSNVLTADQIGASYQWIDCETNQPIVGETSRTFTATQDGSYGVMIGLGECDEMSTCTDLSFVNLDEYTTNLVSVYPNPSNGIFSVNLNNVEATNIRVFNALGAEVYQAIMAGNTFEVDLKNSAYGVYTIQVETNKGMVRQRIIKQ